MDRDALDRLADVLIEDIADASGDDLLAEVEEDFGDAGVLAVAFDEVLADAEALAVPQSQDKAIGHLADALGEDIAAAPPEALLREVAEDYGDDQALAAEFDRAVFGGAAPFVPVSVETSIAEDVQRQRMARSAADADSPARLEPAFAAVLNWLASSVRARTAVAAFAALALFAILTPRLLERLADYRELSASDAPAPSTLPAPFRLEPERLQPPRNESGLEARSVTPLPQSPPSDLKQETAAPPRAAAGGEQAAAPPPMADMRPMAPSPKREEAVRELEGRYRLAKPGGEQRVDETCGREEDGLTSLRGRSGRAAGCAPPRPAITGATPLPAAPSPSAKTKRSEKIHEAQTQLRRLGCFKGKPDGLFNDETQKAVEAFQNRAGKPVAVTGISDELIADLRERPDGMCNAAPPAAAGPTR